MKRLLIALILLTTLLASSALPSLAQQTGAEQGSSQAAAPGSVLPQLYERGGTRLNSGDYEGAALDFSLFLLFNPTYSQGFFARALTQIARDNHDAAITDLTSALAFAPQTSPRYLANLFGLRGQVYQQDGSFALALDDYTSALDLDPTGENYANRGFLLAGARRFEEALADFDSAAGLLPDIPLLALARANLYAQMQDSSAEAAEILRYVNLIQTNVITAGELNTRGEASIVEVTNGDVLLFTFEGEQGQLTSVRAEPLTGNTIDPLLVLLDKDGIPLAANDDANGSSLSAAIRQFELPADGVYTVMLTHALGGDTGRVSITLILEEN